MSQSINIELTDHESALLQTAAGQFGITPQQLAHTTVVDALNRLQNDERFAGIVNEVLVKNSKLYDRLAQGSHS